MEKDLISVIVPVYNVEEYLETCLESIVNQSYRNLQIILVNDGSTDSSPEICQKYAQDDPRIEIISQKNKGLSAARNTGLSVVKGSYVGYIDSDDFVEPVMIESLYRALVASDADIAACGYDAYRDSSHQCPFSTCQEMQLDSEGFIKSILTEDTVGNYVCNKLYKASLWEDITFPEGKVYEDIPVMYQMAVKCNSIRVIPQVLYHYRQRPDSLSNVPNIDYLHQQIELLVDRNRQIVAGNPNLEISCKANVLKFLIVNFNQIAKNYSNQKDELRWYRQQILPYKEAAILSFKYRIMYQCICFAPYLYAFCIRCIYQRRFK